MKNGVPQFGRVPAGGAAPDRTGAHGLLFDDERRLAVVRITPEGLVDLPGGAVDPGEDEEDALVREFLEEAGVSVRSGAVVARAGQIAWLDDGTCVNKLCVFHEVREDGPRRAPMEDDHKLDWLAPEAALALLRHDSHAWAVAAWLRRDRRLGFR